MWGSAACQAWQGNSRIVWEEVPLLVVLRWRESLRGWVGLTRKIHLFLIFWCQDCGSPPKGLGHQGAYCCVRYNTAPFLTILSPLATCLFNSQWQKNTVSNDFQCCTPIILWRTVFQKNGAMFERSAFWKMLPKRQSCHWEWCAENETLRKGRSSEW